MNTLSYHRSWEPIIGPVLEQKLPSIMRAIGTDYLPEDIFAAFRLPQEQVRVLIVGQDPYPTPGHAMGLAFSTAPGIAPPRSLKNIFTELNEDLGITPPADGDLSAWSRQGVLLLNRVLTVPPGKPGGHRGLGWEDITQAAISSLNRNPMVALLWGRDAQRCQSLLPEVPAIVSPHPSPLSARRGFFGSRPFSKVNQLLVDQGSAPIDWRL